jgi:chromosome segregation ATPase
MAASFTQSVSVLQGALADLNSEIANNQEMLDAASAQASRLQSVIDGLNAQKTDIVAALAALGVS